MNIQILNIENFRNLIRKGKERYVSEKKFTKRVNSINEDLKKVLILNSLLKKESSETALDNTLKRKQIGSYYLSNLIMLFLIDPNEERKEKLNYSVVDFQKAFAHLDKTDLVKIEHKETLDELISVIADDKHPFGEIFINNDWEIDGGNTENIEEYKKTILNSKTVDLEELDSKKEHKKFKTEKKVDNIIIKAKTVTITKQNETKSGQSDGVDEAGSIESKLNIFKSLAFIDSLNNFQIPYYVEDHFKLPITLAEKMYKYEWENFEKKFAINNNIYGVQINQDIKEEFFYLELTELGRKKAEFLDEISHEVVNDILIHCDALNRAEYRLFTMLTLKQKFFEGVFRKYHEFNFNIEYLVNMDLFPSSQKIVLYYRLFGQYFFENGNNRLMSHYYNKCIKLLEETPENKLSGFFIGWALKERFLKNESKAIEIFEKVIKIFKRPGTVARLYLIVHYHRLGNRDRVLELFTEEVFDGEGIIPFYQLDKFVDQVNKRISKLITEGFSEEASILQKAIRLLALHLETQHENQEEHERSQFIKKLSNQFDGNFALKTALIKFNLKNNLPKAKILIDELKIKINKKKVSSYENIQLTILLCTYYLNVKGDLSNEALKYALKFIKENSELKEKLNTTYRIIGDIYFKKEDFNKAIAYYEICPTSHIKFHENYLLSLINTRSPKTKELFLNYFSEKPQTKSRKLISQFVTFCIQNNLYSFAGELISEKLKGRRKYDYSDTFISFILQQQIRLTFDYNFALSILKKANDIGDSKIQQSIAFSRFAKHLFYKNKRLKSTTFSLDDNEDDLYLTNEFNIKQALRYYKISNHLKSDVIVRYDIAYCYYVLRKYNKSLDELKMIDLLKYKGSTLIKDKRFHDKILRLEIKILLKKEDVKNALILLDRVLLNKNKRAVHYIIATSKLMNNADTTYHFEKSLKYYTGYKRNLRFAIFLFSIEKEKRSERIISEITKLRGDNDLELIYQNSISDDKKRIKLQKLSFIQEKLKSINIKSDQKETIGLLKDINQLILEYPYNGKIYMLKYEYHFSIENRDFIKCEDVLNKVLEIGLLNSKTAAIFYHFAKSCYGYTHYSYSETISRESKITKLQEGLKNIELAISTDKSNFEYNKLYSFILYRLGDYEKNKIIVREFTKTLNKNEKDGFNKALYIEKKQINDYLWPETLNSYSSKLEFYKFQEQLGITLLKHSNVSKVIPFNIFKTIELDAKFHLENQDVLLNRIKYRLSLFYYEIKNNYEMTYNYCLSIYKNLEFDPSFVQRFLDSTDKLEMYKEGIEICDFYLKIEPNPMIFSFKETFFDKLNK